MKDREELKAYAKERGVKLVEVAKEMGISKQGLSNMMREGLSTVRSAFVEDAIDRIAEEKIEKKEWR
jgi:predicted DNA-binding protein (UPF0251 family)